MLRRHARSYNAYIHLASNPLGRSIDERGHSKSRPIPKLRRLRLRDDYQIPIDHRAGRHLRRHLSILRSGVVIDGANIRVTLRGLTVNGQAVNPAPNGITFAQELTVTIEDCQISDTDIAISVLAPSSAIAIRNSVLRNNPRGIDFAPTISPRAVVAANGIADLLLTHKMIAGFSVGVSVDASPGDRASATADSNAMHDEDLAAFALVNGGGAEVIYTAGNNTIDVNTLAQGGWLIPCCVRSGYRRRKVSPSNGRPLRVGR